MSWLNEQFLFYRFGGIVLPVSDTMIVFKSSGESIGK